MRQGNDVGSPSEAAQIIGKVMTPNFHKEEEMKHPNILLVTLSLVALLLGACVPAPAPSAPSPGLQPTSVQIANPASRELRQAGRHAVHRGARRRRAIWHLLFEDNRQCEEWALLRGDCPVGGIKVTGYVTPAATYCAITGGTYAITGNNGAEDEQGTCTFKDGAQCDAWDYYNGKCDPSTASSRAERRQQLRQSGRPSSRCRWRSATARRRRWPMRWM